MKKTTGNKIRLGIFVSAAIVLFIVGIYFVGERQQLFSSTFQVSSVFKDINGLQVGNNVRFAGINVGIIDEIKQVTDSTVQVNMLIVEDTRKFIKKNAKAIIGSDGLMGNKIVIILTGSPNQPMIADYEFIQSTEAVSMDQIMAKIKVTSDNAAMITDHLAAIMQSIHEGKGTVGKLLMDSVLAYNVEQALINIKQGAGGFKQNMDAAGHNFLLRGFIKKKENEKTDKAKEEKELKEDKDAKDAKKAKEAKEDKDAKDAKIAKKAKEAQDDKDAKLAKKAKEAQEEKDAQAAKDAKKAKEKD